MQDLKHSLIRAARRPGADVGPSLWKRRTWFADDQGTGAASGTQQEPSAADPESDDKKGALSPDLQSLVDLIKSDPVKAADEIKKLRQGEAAQRTARQQAEAEASRKENERLANDKKFEDLSKKLSTDLEQLKPQAERAATLEAKIQGMVDARIKQLPAADRALVPEYDDPLKTMEWLDRNAARFARQAAPELGAGEAGGAGGSGGGEGRLSDEEQQTARAFGIDPKKMSAQKAAMANRPRPSI